MEKYEKAQMEVIEFENEDVITASNCPPVFGGDIIPDCPPECGSDMW